MKLKVVVDWLDKEWDIAFKDVEEAIDFICAFVEEKEEKEVREDFKRLADIISKYQYEILGLRLVKSCEGYYVPAMAINASNGLSCDFLQKLAEEFDYTIKLPHYFKEAWVLEIYTDI